jgi:uncharacterized protein (DUF1499 family)
MKRLSILVISSMMIMGCAGQRPENIGVNNGRLADCPSSPNCVSSQASDPDHMVAPFTYTGEKEEALDRIKNVAESCERTTIIEEREDYLHIECRSAVMGFVDDLEFYFPEEKVIQVRSASRLGRYDFGVNTDRVEYFREMFEKNVQEEK